MMMPLRHCCRQHCAAAAFIRRAERRRCRLFSDGYATLSPFRVFAAIFFTPFSAFDDFSLSLADFRHFRRRHYFRHY
jgi:hypothetical protein